jgi:ketosteroid isomerase-like protein
VDDHELLAELVAKESIRDVIDRYLTAVGAGDWDAVRQCFVPGAYADYGFDGERTIEAQLELVQRGIRRFDASTLLGSNCSVTVDGEAASSDSWALTAHQAPAESGDRTRLSAVRYTDEWARDGDGRWRITRRTLDTAWRAWLDPRRDDRAGDHKHADEW